VNDVTAAVLLWALPNVKAKKLTIKNVKKRGSDKNRKMRLLLTVIDSLLRILNQNLWRNLECKFEDPHTSHGEDAPSQQHVCPAKFIQSRLSPVAVVWEVTTWPEGRR